MSLPAFLNILGEWWGGRGAVGDAKAPVRPFPAPGRAYQLRTDNYSLKYTQIVPIIFYAEPLSLFRILISEKTHEKFRPHSPRFRGKVCAVSFST